MLRMEAHRSLKRVLDVVGEQLHVTTLQRCISETPSFLGLPVVGLVLFVHLFETKTYNPE